MDKIINKIPLISNYNLFNGNAWCKTDIIKNKNSICLKTSDITNKEAYSLIKNYDLKCCLHNDYGAIYDTKDSYFKKLSENFNLKIIK